MNKIPVKNLSLLIAKSAQGCRLSAVALLRPTLGRSPSPYLQPREMQLLTENILDYAPCAEKIQANARNRGFHETSCSSCGPAAAAVAIPAAGSVFLADLQSARYKLTWQQLPPSQIINTVHRNHTGQDQLNRRSFSKRSPLKCQEFLGNMPTSTCCGEPCHSTASAFHLSRAKHHLCS